MDNDTQTTDAQPDTAVETGDDNAAGGLVRKRTRLIRFRTSAPARRRDLEVPTAIPLARSVELERPAEPEQSLFIPPEAIPHRPIIAAGLLVMGVFMDVGAIGSIWPLLFGLIGIIALLVCYWVVQSSTYPLSGAFFAFLASLVSGVLALAAIARLSSGANVAIILAFVCFIICAYIAFEVGQHLLNAPAGE